MSGALINRSLTTIRTELEFLYDSEVIDKALFDTLVAAIPQKYSKDAEPWGVDKLSVPGGNKDASKSSVDQVSDSLAAVTVQDAIAPPSHPPAPLPPRSQPAAIGYCKALFNYDAQESGDLALTKDDRIAVMEHLSPEWWKGYKQLDPSNTGVFPSNYVSVISEAEFKNTSRGSADEKATYNPEKASYNADKTDGYTAGPPAYHPPPSPQYGYAVQQQPSYGGYAQFPPPSTNYYPPQQPQQQQPQQQQQLAPPQEVQPQSSGNSHPHLKKFGSKLGNAAIFGAGATIGSDIVNLIF